MPIIKYVPIGELPYKEERNGERTYAIPEREIPNITDLREYFASIGIVVKPGLIESYNFVAGSAGWQFKADGTITGLVGSLGGWTLAAGYIYSLASGTPTSSPSTGIVLASTNPVITVYEGTNKRVELGYLSAAIFGLKGYATDGTTVIFELSDTQQKIAGFNFTDLVLRTGTTDANSNVLIDSANSLMRLGPTTGNSIALDGANLRIRSSNYVTGVSGFTVEPTLIEAENLVARGIMRGSTFQYDIISAIGGQLMCANADVLSTDMTALDASTLTIRGLAAALAVNDILVIRAVTASGIQEEWLRVTAIGSAPTYSVTRDLAGSFAADNNPVWQAGTTVVKQGASDGAAAYSGGWLRLFGEGTNSPYYSVFERTGVAYNAYTERVRMGNLNGFLDYASNIFGFGVGASSATDANITIDPTNGIRVRSGTTTVFQVDNSGNISLATDIFTASEALTALDRVSVIATSGQVEKTIRHNFANPGAFQTISSTGGASKSSCCKVTNDKVAIFSEDGTDWYVVIGTVDRTTLAITWGDKTTVAAGGATGSANHHPTVLYMSDDKLAFLYRSGATSIRMRIATVSGTTPTLGTEITLDTTAVNFEALSMTLLDTDKIAIAHIESNGGANYDLHVYNVTVSGTTVTSYFANEVTQADAGDEIDGCAIVATSTTNCIVVYSNGAAADGRAWRVTWSGNTPTSSTNSALGAAGSLGAISLVADKATSPDYVVAVFTATNTHAMTIHPTTVVLGAILNVTGTVPRAIGTGRGVMTRIANNRFFYWQAGGDVAELINGGTTMYAVASTNTFDGSSWTTNSLSIATLDESRVKFVFGGYIGGGTTLLSFNAWSEYDNTDTMIGVAASTVAAAATVAVYGKDTRVSGFAGLTVGSKYYIDYKTDTLTTTNTGVQLGVAKTATVLRVDISTKYVYRMAETTSTFSASGRFRFYHNAGTIPNMIFMHSFLGTTWSDANYGTEGTYRNKTNAGINTSYLMELSSGGNSVTATVVSLTKHYITLNATVIGSVSPAFIYEAHT
ncbi:hypothetical protein HY469_05260 [Candidatus Roizmanbacteria bacterium]|nr:hypothetical protein [Candidatus Roizmanbacteria bacterium]